MRSEHEIVLCARLSWEITASEYLAVYYTGVITVTARNLFFAQFFYRVNSNKSMESICGDCFLASPASGETAELQAWEHAHRCLSQSV
jgi:hypothetical protein